MSGSSTKLQQAGIPISLSPQSVPIGEMISIRSFFAPSALKPGDFGDAEGRLRAIYKAVGLSGGMATGLLAAGKVPAHTSRDQLLSSALQQSTYDSLAMWRAERSESARSIFRSNVANSSDHECFEAAFGLCALGVNQGDLPHLLSALKSQSDDDRKTAIVTALFQGDLLGGLIADGELDELSDDLKILELLSELLDTDDPSNLIELCHSGGLSWQKRICVHYILGHLAPRFASLEYLEALLEVFTEEDDSDASVMSMYAVGQVVERVGVDAVQRVLQYAIDDLSGGSRKQCTLINSAYRARLNADEVNVVIHQINGFDESDQDTKRSLGRALDVFQGTCEPSNWLFTGGYGRGYDLFDPFYDTPHFFPNDLWLTFSKPSRLSMRTWLKTISKMSISREFTALTGSLMLSTFPEVLPVLVGFVRDESNSDQTRSGIAAAILCSDLECDLSPVLLRCLLNEEHSGGPIMESPAIIGELLYYSQQSGTQMVARELMRSLSPESREICASFLRAGLSDQSDDQELEQLLFSMGASSKSPRPQATVTPDLRLAIGESLASHELIDLIQNASEENRAEFAQLVVSMVDGNDRQRDLQLAQEQALWSQVPVEVIQPHLLSLSQGNWVAREVASVLAGSVGTSVIAGPLGERISEMLQRLCNDSDSDVTREAKRAATLLNVKVLIIDEENIRAGLQSDDAGEWAQHLYKFIKSEDSRSEILNLCRAAEVWSSLDPEELANFWLEVSQGGWIAREAAAVIAINHPNLLVCSRAEEITQRIIALSQDSDDDVEREAKTACVTLGL